MMPPYRDYGDGSDGSDRPNEGSGISGDRSGSDGVWVFLVIMALPFAPFLLIGVLIAWLVIESLIKGG